MAVSDREKWSSSEDVPTTGDEPENDQEEEEEGGIDHHQILKYKK